MTRNAVTARTIRAIAFDAYGTLFDVHAIGVLADELFPDHGKALADLWRVKQIDYTRLRTMSDRYAPFSQVTREALVFAGKFLGLPLNDEHITRLMRAYDRLAVFPENETAIARLKARGLPLAILSNGDPAMLAAVVAHAGLDDVFDHLLSVDAVRRYKTAAEAYALAPTAFSLNAKDILFVSSNGWDVCGATWFGFTSFWINRAGAPREELGVAPHGEGRTMDDVVAFVATLRD